MILLVDDVPANLDIMLEILGDRVDAAVALNGEEALEIMEEETPQAVLLDIIMPGMSGFEVFARMKEIPALAHVPVIFLSGDDGPQEREKARAMGAVAYLKKPADPERVLEAVGRYFN